MTFGTHGRLVVALPFKSGWAKNHMAKKYGEGETSDFKFYINPTKDELEDIHPRSRGFVDLKGNLYLLRDANKSYIHIDIMNLLSAVLPIHAVGDDYHNYTFKQVGGIAVIRANKEIWFSESVYSGHKDNSNLERINLKSGATIFHKAKSLNPHLSFHMDWK